MTWYEPIRPSGADLLGARCGGHIAVRPVPCGLRGCVLALSVGPHVSERSLDWPNETTCAGQSGLRPASGPMPGSAAVSDRARNGMIAGEKGPRIRVRGRFSGIEHSAAPASGRREHQCAMPPLSQGPTYRGRAVIGPWQVQMAGNGLERFAAPTLQAPQKEHSRFRDSCSASLRQ